MAEGALPFFNQRGDLLVSRNRLGHWQQQGGAVYFLTFRLADSLPATVLNPWQLRRDAWLRENPAPHTPEQESDYHFHFTSEWEALLDSGQGACVLRDPRCSEAAMAALRHFDGERIGLHAAVVMPNHVHALFELYPGQGLSRFVGGLKGVSARNINRLLGLVDTPLWQKDYFDRLVRDESHYGRCVRYIARNPDKAKLSPTDYRLFLSERAAVVLPPG